MAIQLTTPLTQEKVRSLRSGDEVFISGEIFTGRDAAHKRLTTLVSEGKELPIELRDAIIYFVGPTPARPGEVIGSAGPTTSYRMDAYSPMLIEKCGLTGMIGKGERDECVVSAMKEFGAVYFAAIGGAGALISKSITAAEVICYEDLGPEAIHRLTVVDFPVVVAQDSFGNSLFESGPATYKR